jgi:hypothetical protein
MDELTAAENVELPALICRLVARDLRRRPAQAVLLLAITAATTVLTLALALHGVTSQPYQSTRAATAGPDVVDQFGLPGRGPGNTVPGLKTQVSALVHDAAVTGHSGPYPIAAAVLRAHGITTVAQAEGRDRVTLDGRSFRVAGIAVTAASPPYPNFCEIDCSLHPQDS